jgi:hypothetical protein
MGGFTDWRNFLFHLFGDCFTDQLPNDTSFDVCIIDLMQFMAPLIKNRVNSNGTFLNVDDTIHSLLTTVKYYMNNGNDPNVPSLSHVVLLMDSILNVPKNKVTTQQSRDETTVVANSLKRMHIEQGCKDLEEEEGEEEEGTSGNDDTESSCILDELRYYELVKKLNIDEHHHLCIKYDMKNDGVGCIPSINGSTLWRSISLKWQIYRMITHELLQLEVKRGKVVVIDEGVAIEESIYESLRQTMINDYSFNERSMYEKECLVSNLILKHIVERFVLHDNHTFTRMPNKPELAGEADIKLLQYITPNNGASKFLVVSQDTDIIFILLLHMKRFINQKTSKLDASFDVVIDTQTPSDKSSGVNKPYRFINIKRLWHRMSEFFRQEYFTLNNPIETFVFMVNSLKTDFTSSFNPYLRITNRELWNAFSELHYTPLKKTEKKGSSILPPKQEPDEGYILFCNTPPSATAVIPLKRCNKSHYTPSLRHVLDEAIKYQFTPNTQTFHFILNSGQIEKFYYLLCQKKLVSDMASLGYRQFQKNDILSNNKAYIASPTDIFIYANDVMSKIDAYRKESTQSITNEHYNKLFSTPPPPSKQPSLNKSFRPSLNGSGSGSGVSTPPINKKQQEFLKKLAEKVLPPQWGIPSEKEMKARIYRIHWILEYYQNGGLAAKYAKNYSDVSNMDNKLSVWGWKCEYITRPTVKDFNSTYYYNKMRDNHAMHSGTMPFQLFNTVETNEIFNRDNRRVI